MCVGTFFNGRGILKKRIFLFEFFGFFPEDLGGLLLRMWVICAWQAKISASSSWMATGSFVKRGIPLGKAS
jgi:hypothetical protein